ncbi:MAG: insulinase family protein [Phycisphaerales bacterium]|nr:insulinase family protein [Phycisphaerales bacterium]
MEPIASVSSCSIHWVVPAGTAYDNEERVGVSTILSEMLLRGAAERDSRRLSDDMDRIGLERDCGASGPHAWLVGTVLGQFLDQALSLFTDVIRQPALPGDALPACKSLAQQAIESLEDEPQQEVMLYVRRRHQKPPLNRSSYGFMDVLESVTTDELRASWSAGFVPGGSILGLAGDIDPDAVTRQLEDLLSGWAGSQDDLKPTGPSQGGRGHLQRDSSQLHIGMGWAGPSASEEDAILERLATRILGGSTSGRLFTEVRQRRSLCYSVSAGYRARRDEGLISLYAGTTPDRAAETLAVCEEQINGMRSGVDDEEFARAMKGMRGSTVFNGERIQARSAALVGDIYAIGRARTMDERLGELDSVDRDRLNAYLEARPAPVPTIVTVGSESLGPDFAEEPPLCHRTVEEC